MPDQIKPSERTDEERRQAAAKASAQDATANRGTQVHAPAPNQPSKPKEPARGVGAEESFEHAGRAVRAQPSTRQDPANQRQRGKHEDVDASPFEDDQRDPKSDEDADPSDTSFPIDERIERKKPMDEEED